MSSIIICQWNSNGISQKKREIEFFLQTNDIDILLLSETHLTSKNNFCIPNFIFYNTNHPDDKAHGGTGILIRNRLKHYALEEFSKDYLQATSICLKCWDGDIVISSVYCPPRYNISDSNFIEFFKTLGNKFIAAGDYNAKHTHWGSRLINPKGKSLYSALQSRQMNLDFISTGQPTTYCPQT